VHGTELCSIKGWFYVGGINKMAIDVTNAMACPNLVSMKCPFANTNMKYP
jgi:hypothetical protein